MSSNGLDGMDALGTKKHVPQLLTVDIWMCSNGLEPMAALGTATRPIKQLQMGIWMSYNGRMPMVALWAAALWAFALLLLAMAIWICSDGLEPMVSQNNNKILSSSVLYHLIVRGEEQVGRRMLWMRAEHKSARTILCYCISIYTSPQARERPWPSLPSDFQASCALGR